MLTVDEFRAKYVEALDEFVRQIKAAKNQPLTAPGVDWGALFDAWCEEGEGPAELETLLEETW